MRRRWLSLLLVGGISLSLAACGGGDGPSAGEGGGKSAPALAAPGPAAPGSAGTLAGEWVSREADLYFAFFEDGYCIYARAQSMNRVNGMSDYNAAGGCLSMTADVGDLSTYTISGDVMTLKVDGTDYTFIRPVSPAVENGDYSVRADTEVMKKLAYYMERAVGDTLVKFDGDRQVYATPLATFSVPISARRWADTYEYNSGIAHCVVDFFGFDGNVEVDVQVSSNNRRGTTPERFKEQFAEDYPGAEIGSQSAGDQGQYDYSELKPFSTAYLPGFLADKYDVTVEQSQARADLRCENTLEAALRGTVEQYSTCIRMGGSTQIHRGKVHYALMPVWMLNTKWNGKDYLFAMNGQTGRLVGDLPMSWGRFWARFAAIAAPLSVLGTVLSILLVR